MIRTKVAKEILTKAEQRHLTEIGVHSMASFRSTREHQLAMEEAEKEAGRYYVACFECRRVARKLGLS